MEAISLSIDGKRVTCPPGTSILDAAKENGIRIPTLCHHPHLEPVGACRLCLVEDVKTGRLLAACVRLVSQGMAIRTDSPSITKYRKNIIRLMMANHPESCILCNQGNRCELRKIAAELGVGETGLYPMPHYCGFEEANPFIIRDLSKCILCGKCIRADHELVVVGAIDYNLRGFRSRPATAHQAPLEKSSCTFCGTCVSMCPTGALTAKNPSYVGSPQRETTTICGFCGGGCSLVMGSVDERIVDVNPSHEGHTVNRSTLCVRGHFAHDFLNTSARLTTPMIRRDGELTPVRWGEALEFVAERLLAIKDRYGPQSLAFLGSSKCSVEENYLFQKIARVMIRTNNIDNGGYLLGRPALSRVHERLGGCAPPTPLSGLEEAEVILVMGANPPESVPVAGYYLKRASRIKGIPMIVADPRRTELVPFSALWLPLAPNSDLEFLNGLAAMLLRKEAYDAEFIDRFTEDFDQYCKGLAALDLDRVSRITGLGIEKMEKAAELVEGKRISFVIGHGILQQRFGAQALDALLNLCLLTGSLAVPERCLYFLAAENNAIGAWDMGAAPDFLPGRLPLGDDRSRKELERAWQVKLSPDPGLNMIRMIEEAEKGNLKALYIMGENPLRSLPQPERLRKALEKLEFLLVQDILSNETTDLADVVLPGAPFSEKGGSFTNLEGRIQPFEPVVSPPGDAKPDWEILALLYQRMGHRERYLSHQDIRAEIVRVAPLYSELEKSDGESWIKETSELRLFNPNGKEERILFSPLISLEDQEFDNTYPLKAILVSVRYHLGSGTRTGHSDRIKDFALKGEVEISLQDADFLDLKERDKVRISSPYGSISREVTLKKDLIPGLIFIPTGINNNDARQLVGLTQLGESDSSGWKGCDVRLEKIEDA